MMSKPLFLIFLFAAPFLISQNRFLLHVNANGRQEALPIRPNERIADAVVRFGSSGERISGIQFLDSLKFFQKSSDLSYEFGNLEEEMMLQWYMPAGDGFVREVCWAIASDVGATQEVNVRLWYPNPRLKNVPATQIQKNTGYYPKSDDPVNLVTPYRELATDTTWVYPPKTSDSLTYAFDPLGVEATWKKGGVNAPVSAYSWHSVNLLTTGDTMKFQEDQLIGFTILNTAKTSVGARQEVASLPNPDPPFHSYKFYPRGRLSTTDRGWWLRGDFDWGMYMVVEYFSAPKPKVTSEKLLNTAVLTPRTITAVVKTQSAADPVEVKLFSKVGKGAWTASAMTRTAGFEFTGEIPAGQPDDSVYYYITAKDDLARTTQSPTYAYQVLKKNKNLLLLFNGKNLPSGIVDPSIYLKFTMKTDFGQEPYYDFCYVNRYTIKELPALLNQYNAVIEVTGDGGAFDISSYAAQWLEQSASLPAGKKRYYLWADQDHGFISNYADTVFADTDHHVKYFGVKGLINQDFPRTVNNFREVNFPWRLSVTAKITGDAVFGFIPGAMQKDTVSLWYHPYYEVPLFTNRMDEIQPAASGEVIFTDFSTGKPVGMRTVDPNGRWQSYFFTFDWMALEFRSDTSTQKYSYPFLDPKYQWIVDVQNIGKTFAQLPGTTPVSVRDVVPASFAVKQNYPNPFNPSTSIEFSLPEWQHVSLTVFDLLGKEIATLASGPFRPGRYSVRWDATGLPSGVYFYRLTAGRYSETRRMVLIK